MIPASPCGFPLGMKISHLLGSLDAEWTPLLKEHLAECEYCRLSLHDLEVMTRMFMEVPSEATSRKKMAKFLKEALPISRQKHA